MKFIKAPITPPDTKVFVPEDVSETYYYGVNLNGEGIGFITRNEYERGDFRLKAWNSLTSGNAYNHRCPTLAGLIQILMGIGFEVHEFASDKEFFRWVADNC
jgi:hypothetical protein